MGSDCVCSSSNNGQIMTEGFGNTNQQAEKNASIMGLLWFKENKSEEIEAILTKSIFSQRLKACFMHHGNISKFKK